MDPPRWIVDEMLGRLARYLRFVGHDTSYVRGATDAEVVARARTENRRLITRDRQLAGRVPDSILVRSPHLPEQLRSVRDSCPTAGFEVRFDRCSLCNGLLEEQERLAPDRAERRHPIQGPVFRCAACGHVYWEGSHTDRIRSDLAQWLGQ